MATAQKAADQPVPLNLGLDALHSSPFPSPGSSFLPPPRPGPHEFARPPSAGRRPSKKDLDDLPPIQHNGSSIVSPTAPNGHATYTCSGEASPTTPNGAESALPTPTVEIPGSYLDTPLASPTMRDPPTSSAPHTPTELSCFIPDRLVNNSDLSPSQDPEDVVLYPQPPHRLSTQSVTSLTSSRPAPPSPAISRRASGLSRASSKSLSRPVSSPVASAPRPVSGVLTSSTVLSRASSGRRAKDILGMSAVAESKEKEREEMPITTITATTTTTTTTAITTTPTTNPAEPSRAVVLIKIRDFAFGPSDPRFSGEGPNVPRPNRPEVLARRLRGSSSPSSASTSSSTEEEDEQWEDENDGNGWGGFKWGFQKMQSGWGFGSRPMMEDFPTRTDFARNFGDGGPGGGGGGGGANDHRDDDDDDDDGDDDDDDDFEVYEDPEEYSEKLDGDGDGDGDVEMDMDMEGEPVLHPGLYRAMYAFEPEGTAEMKLDEDQIVRVVGRGGGVGWAVVVKDGLKDMGAHALVPESYLELVRLDDADEEK